MPLSGWTSSLDVFVNRIESSTPMLCRVEENWPMLSLLWCPFLSILRVKFHCTYNVTFHASDQELPGIFFVCSPASRAT